LIDLVLYFEIANHLKGKTMKRLLICVLPVFLGACATDMSRYYDVQQKAVEADNAAVMGLAAAAATGNQGAIMALALRQGSAGKIAPPQDKALVWASILVPSLTNLYGINRNTSVQLANINAETQQYGATMGTIQGIATGAFNNPTYLPMQPSETPTYLPVTPGAQSLRPVEATPTTP
jgi:hypothetical protein